MADLKKLAEELVNLTVKDVKELADILKEEYGIEPAAAAVAVAAPAAGGAAAGGLAAVPDGEPHPGVAGLPHRRAHVLDLEYHFPAKNPPHGGCRHGLRQSRGLTPASGPGRTLAGWNLRRF